MRERMNSVSEHGDDEKRTRGMKKYEGAVDMMHWN
jgi:hypothetical protein